MPKITLSALSVGLGLVFGLPQIYGLVKPAAFAGAVRKFPRSTTCGYFLMGLGTLWFVWNVQQESIADFPMYKKYLLLFFALIGVGACVYIKDFLAVRGAAVLMLLLAKLMVDTARWANSDWRLVIVTWAYAWVIAGMWFTISPWRMRDLLYWATANETRVRVGSALRLAFGLFITVLGLTVV